MEKNSREHVKNVMCLFILILIISIVLNIVLLTRPAFGSYTGEATETSRQDDYSIAVKYKFRLNGDISVIIKDTDSYGNDRESQDIGRYVKKGKKLFFYLCSLDFDGRGGDSVTFREYALKRHSVFHLSEVDNRYYKGDYYSGWAITLQVILGIIDFICIIKIIANGNKLSKEKIKVNN